MGGRAQRPPLNNENTPEGFVPSGAGRLLGFAEVLSSFPVDDYARENLGVSHLAGFDFTQLEHLLSRVIAV